MTKKTVGSVVTTYVYNIEDRLSAVWDGEVGTGSLTAIYYYDPFGRRLWKDVSGARTHFHYADEGLVAELENAGTVTKSYGYKPGSTWTTDPLFMKEGSSYYFYQNDHLGTPQKLTAINGAVVWASKYSSFGKATIEVETVENNLRFPGQYYDEETGLHYNWFRYYEPGIGRYLRADPIGNPGRVNPFIYSLNNILKYFDATGEIEKSCSPKTEWQSETVIGSQGSNKPTLISKVIKDKWAFVQEYPAIVIPGRDSANEVVCGCQWELVGMVEENVYEKKVLYSRELECKDNDCIIKKPWRERQYGYAIDRKTVYKNIPSIVAPGVTHVTFGFPTIGGCSCKDDYKYD